MIRVLGWTLLHFVWQGAAVAALLASLNLALRRPHEFREAIALAWEWLQLGERARGYSSVRFEELMDLPVEEVRALVTAPAA